MDLSSPRAAWMVAVASGPGRPRRSSSRAPAIAANEGARRGRSSRPRWAASGPSSRAADDADAQLKVVHGAASGAAPPPLFPPEAPPRRAPRPEPAPSATASAVLATAAGVWRAHVQR